MDPFSSMETTNIMTEASSLLNKKKITIKGESRGRKADTYIINWELSEEDEQTHLKKMKKSFGCNGSIKFVDFDGKKDIKALHLQGDKIQDAKKYLISLNINIKDLDVKEIIMLKQ